jgi:hypothetical protein
LFPLRRGPTERATRIVNPNSKIELAETVCSRRRGLIDEIPHNLRQAETATEVHGLVSLDPIRPLHRALEPANSFFTEKADHGLKTSG